MKLYLIVEVATTENGENIEAIVGERYDRTAAMKRVAELNKKHRKEVGLSYKLVVRG